MGDMQLNDFLFDSVSEASKGKKIQKSLLGMLDKNDDENDVDNGSDIEEEETSARYGVQSYLLESYRCIYVNFNVTSSDGNSRFQLSKY